MGVLIWEMMMKCLGFLDKTYVYTLSNKQNIAPIYYSVNFQKNSVVRSRIYLTLSKMLGLQMYFKGYSYTGGNVNV